MPRYVHPRRGAACSARTSALPWCTASVKSETCGQSSRSRLEDGVDPVAADEGGRAWAGSTVPSGGEATTTPSSSPAPDSTRAVPGRPAGRSRSGPICYWFVPVFWNHRKAGTGSARRGGGPGRTRDGHRVAELGRRLGHRLQAGARHRRDGKLDLDLGPVGDGARGYPGDRTRSVVLGVVGAFLIRVRRRWPRAP